MRFAQSQKFRNTSKFSNHFVRGYTAEILKFFPKIADKHGFYGKIQRGNKVIFA